MKTNLIESTESKTAKHTSGLWSKSFINGHWHVAALGGGLEIAKVTALRNQNESESNAKLIAAAPELLTACQEMLLYIERVTAHRGAMDAEQLAAEEIHVRKYVASVESGRWAGDTVRADLAAARSAITKATL